jgi:ubiquinone/menaquinone biosynthesis C-methylase UbiE
MPDLDLERHWSDVGREIQNRPEQNLLAGDDSPYYRYKADLCSSTFLPQMDVSGRAVLEVGCGAGRVLQQLAARHPARLVGCDQAGEMVTLAARNLGGRAEIVHVDGDSLPFGDEEFDVVTTVTVLQHNPDDRRARLLGEMCRVAKDEVFLFEDTTLSNPPGTDAVAGEGQYQNYYGRPLSWYAEVCAGHGFSLMDTQRLETFISNSVSGVLYRVLSRDRTSEGSPFSKAHRALEGLSLPITRRLDRLFKSPGELTLMRFRRQTGSSSG